MWWTPLPPAQPTRDVYPMLVQCWNDVVDGGPTLNQHWVNVSRLLGLHLSLLSVLKFQRSIAFFYAHSLSLDTVQSLRDREVDTARVPISNAVSAERCRMIHLTMHPSSSCVFDPAEPVKTQFFSFLIFCNNVKSGLFWGMIHISSYAWCDVIIWQ